MPLVLLALLACKDEKNYDITAALKGNTIVFSGSKDAKVQTCGNIKDKMNTSAKTNQGDAWVSEAVVIPQGLYFKDGSLYQQTSSSVFCLVPTTLTAIAGKSFDIPESYIVARGTRPLGQSNFETLKAKDPGTAYTADTQIPNYETAKTKYYRIEFPVIKLDGKASKTFVQEFELKNILGF
jgi:hypothetical protein